MAIDFYTQKYDAKITKVQMNSIEMSSSDIRNRINLGKSIKYMVCDSVIDYIQKNRIYEGCN